MHKETKKNKETVLKKEHFEILLEDIQSSVKAIAEGHGILNNKIDKVSSELHETKNELIFLIKAAVDHSEERLNKKINGLEQKVDGLEQKVDGLEQKVDNLEQKVNNLEQKIEDGDRAVMEHVDLRFDETNQKIDAINNNLKAHADNLAEHDERISRLERKTVTP